MNSLDEIERRLRKRSPGKWKASDFGSPSDQEPTSIVIHTGPFNWNAIYYGPDSEEAVDWEGEVVASVDAELYEDAALIADAPEDLEALVKFVREIQELEKAARSLGVQAAADYEQTGAIGHKVRQLGHEATANALRAALNTLEGA